MLVGLIAGKQDDIQKNTGIYILKLLKFSTDSIIIRISIGFSWCLMKVYSVSNAFQSAFWIARSVMEAYKSWTPCFLC